MDDSADDRAAARGALRAGTLRRYELEERETGEGALSRLLETDALYDCCICDFHLPDMDAVTFIERVRAAGVEKPQLLDVAIVVLTGSAGYEVNRTVIRAGAQDFVGKDWLSSETLNRAVENATERQAMSRELRTRDAEIRAGERRLRQVIESMHIHVAMLAPDGTLMESNSAPFRDCHADASMNARLPIWDCARWNYDADVRERLIAAFRKAVTREGVQYDEWIEIAPGERMLLDVALEPVRDDAGELLFVVLSAVDVTQRRRAEEERERLLESERGARAEAERANRLKDEFLATLSHELRTPLNAILGWAQMLRIGKLAGDSVRRGLETIERNAKTQAQLIEDLLDMSRILSGKLRLDEKTLSLADIVDASIATIVPSAEAKGVTINKALEVNRADVQGDSARLQQIIWNLLSNAVKFTPAGGRIDVRLTHEGDDLKVAVTDSGQGIKPDFLPHVFERFRQADATTTRQHGGLGLGLAIVKHLAELHHGTVSVASDGPGTGSTFTVTLPTSRNREKEANGEFDDGEPRTIVIDPSLRSTLSEINLSGIRVLTVDDDADAREVASRVLAECGATVETTSSVDEAIAQLHQTFDVLITDIGMPARDGYELIRWVRGRETADGRRMPMIAMTAFASVEDRRRILREGFNFHLVKPADPAELCGVVANLVGRYQS